MRRFLFTTLLFSVFLATLAGRPPATAAPAERIPPRSRCPVCGMFVAQYPIWVTQIRLTDGGALYFDGVKDMLAYYFHPARFKGNRERIRETWVKDYYTLQWLDGYRAFYVIGSDIYGPMGKELIPFSSRKAAESFLADHHGDRILTFKDITAELIEKMRHGQKMR